VSGLIKFAETACFDRTESIGRRLGFRDMVGVRAFDFVVENPLYFIIRDYLTETTGDNDGYGPKLDRFICSGLVGVLDRK
jgi:hypothetical protein